MFAIYIHIRIMLYDFFSQVIVSKLCKYDFKKHYALPMKLAFIFFHDAGERGELG